MALISLSHGSLETGSPGQWACLMRSFQDPGCFSCCSAVPWLWSSVVWSDLHGSLWEEGLVERKATNFLCKECGQEVACIYSHIPLAGSQTKSRAGPRETRKSSL